MLDRDKGTLSRMLDRDKGTLSCMEDTRYKRLQIMSSYSPKNIHLGTCSCYPLTNTIASALTKSIYDKSFVVLGQKLYEVLPHSVTPAPSLASAVV